MNNRVRWSMVALMGLLMVTLAGCTSLFMDPRTDLPASQEAFPIEPEQSSIDVMSLRERIAYRAVLESSYHEDVSAQFRRGSRPYIETVREDIQAVVISLDLPQDQTQEEGPHVFPYVLFLVNSASRDVLDAFRITPMLDSRTVTIESLDSRRVTTVAMSDYFAEEILARNDVAANRILVRPKDNLCDPDGYSWSGYVCKVMRPAYLDTPAYEECVDQCSFVMPGPLALTCLPICWSQHWYPEMCLEWVFVVIEPC